jgi:hypothetical protein
VSKMNSFSRKWKWKNTGKQLGWILLVLILLPSSNIHIFNGLPFSGLAEYALLLTLLPFLFSSRLSRLHGVILARTSRKLTFIFILIAILAAVVKLTLFASGTYEGFKACYSSPAAKSQVGECERSYENLFMPEVTRIDKVVSFDASNWNLGFINSKRFNFYAWKNGNYDRKWLPLSVAWSGTVQVDPGELIAVKYNGSGTIKIGDVETSLPAQYGKPNQVEMSVASGLQPVEIHFSFDDGYRVGDNSYGEYANFKLLRVENGTGKLSPVEPVSPAAAWQFLGLLVDLVIVLLWVSFLLTYFVVFRKQMIVWLVVFLAGWCTLLAPELPGLTRPRMMILLLCAVFAYLLLWKKTKHRLLMAFLCFASLGIFRILMDANGLGAVVVRFGGSDFLTYQSFARVILESGSLRAGEGTFYYQPAFRYIAYLLHVLLGDGDVLVSAFSISALTWGIFFLAHNLLRRSASLFRRGLMLGVIFIILVMVNSSQVVLDLIMHGASEYPTWIILPIVLGFILSPKPARYWPIITILIGLGIIIRTDQVPAFGLIYLVFLMRSWSELRRIVLPSVMLLVAICLLPALHNYVYDHVLALLPSSKDISANVAIPPMEALRTLGSADTRSLLLVQLKDLAGFVDRYNVTIGLALPLHLLQVVWLLACVYTLVRWRLSGWVVKLLLFVLPWAYLLVYVFYFSWLDYPRHVLAGYLAMGFGIMALIGSVRDRESVEDKGKEGFQVP